MTTCVLLAATLIFSAAGELPPDPPGRALRISDVQGSATWQAPLDAFSHPAKINAVLSEGDSVDTASGGRIELHLGVLAVRVAPQSHLIVTALSDVALTLEVTRGSVNLTAVLLPAGQHVEVRAESAALLIETPGHYRIGLDPDAHRASMAVRAGEASLHLGAQVRALGANQSVGLSRLAAPTLADASARDAFDAWCDERDEHDADSKSLQHVSRDTVGYADLDGHGNWIDTSDGPAWSPSEVGAQWAPYTEGQWQWSDVYGWTWVDDASWGYAPSHYGRWGYYDDQWAWVPGPVNQAAVYAPALVAFLDINAFADGLIATWAYTAWFALAPHEPYIPGYRTSQGYVHRANPGIFLDTVPGANRAQPHAVVAVRDKVMQQSQSVAAARQPLSSQARAYAPATGSYARIFPPEAVAPNRRPAARQSASVAPAAWAQARRASIIQNFRNAVSAPAARPGGPVQTAPMPRGRDYAAEHRVPPPHQAPVEAPPTTGAPGAGRNGVVERAPGGVIEPFIPGRIIQPQERPVERPQEPRVFERPGSQFVPHGGGPGPVVPRQMPPRVILPHIR